MGYTYKTDEELGRAVKQALTKPINKEEFIEGIDEALNELSLSELEETIENMLPKDVMIHHADETVVALNVKNRGYWSTSILKRKVAEKTGKPLEEIANILTDDDVYDAWTIYTEEFLRVLNGEFDDKVTVVGRSGGWWGFDIDDVKNSEIITIDDDRLDDFFKGSQVWDNARIYFKRVAETFEDPDDYGNSFSKQFGKTFIEMYGIEKIEDMLVLEQDFDNRVSKFVSYMKREIRANEKVDDNVVEWVIAYFNI